MNTGDTLPHCADLRIADDIKTTADTYTFLTLWFKRYTAFTKQRFYIMGESYA